MSPMAHNQKIICGTEIFHQRLQVLSGIPMTLEPWESTEIIPGQSHAKRQPPRRKDDMVIPQLVKELTV